MMFDSLMERALELGSRVDTDWADEHESKYEAFENAIEEAYRNNGITAQEHDDLALTAFYDYDRIYYYT